MIGSVSRWLFKNPLEDKLLVFLDRATEFGLHEEDRANAIDMLKHNELGCAFNIVVTQLFEYGIEIDSDFLRCAQEIGDEMKIDRREYAFLEKLLMKHAEQTN